jgi:hypothetical protein
MRNEGKSITTEHGQGKQGLMIKACVLFIMLLLLAVQVQAGYPYPELINRINPEVREILITHGMAVRHDRENPWVYGMGRPGKYTIIFFRADEIPQAAKLETIRYCMDLYEERGRKERFRIKMYRETITERNKLFSGVKPFFELTIGGND